MFQPYNKVDGNYMSLNVYFAGIVFNVSNKSYNCNGNSPNPKSIGTPLPSWLH